LSTYNPADLVYFDESGIGMGESYPYAWSKKGERALATKSGKYRARINFMAALHGRQFMAPFMLNGNCDALVFETYLEKFLLPELLPGKIIIVDNAAFHKSARAKALVQAKGCQLIFLPAYSPDLNPIEHGWFPIKNKIRQLLDLGESIDNATLRVLKQSSESI
jgi:transposase